MKSKILFFILILLPVFGVHAQEPSMKEMDVSSISAAYRKYKDVDVPSIKVPTVVEVSFANELITRSGFAVLDETANSFEPYFFKQEAFANEIPATVSSDLGAESSEWMNDKDVRTYADFPLPENGQGRAQIILTASQPITSSLLTLLLDNNVALPSSVEIRALVGSENRIVVASQKMSGESVRFPQTSSSRWIITFLFSQPLRINELQLYQDNLTRSTHNTVRFLAQPNHDYRIYFDPDRSVVSPVGEAGDLISARDIKILSYTPSENNPAYVIADVDSDGLPDIRDNCVTVANPDQQDLNNNGRGDACDDFDEDGITNLKDNCPNNPNRYQEDRDGDQIGDVCDREESRLTERYHWIPWVGIGFAGLVLVILFAITVRGVSREVN